MLRSLSVIIPAYNEEQRLPSTLDAVIAYLQSGPYSPWELIVVNDGSRDGTADLVRRRAATEPNLRLLENPGNKGKGYSVRHGMLEGRHDWLLLSDADLSAPIEELSKLFEAIGRGEGKTAVAIGSRALDRSLIGTHQSVFREFGGRFFNLMVQLGTGLRIWDTQCGFKLFRRDAAREIFRRQQLERFGFDVEALFIARRLGFPIVEVPVRWNHVDGTKVNMLKDSIDMFGDIARVRWNALKGLYR